MNLTKLGYASIFAVSVLAFAVGGFAENNVPFLEDHSGQCLRLLHETFGEEEGVYSIATEILFNARDRDRNTLISICQAFHDQPDVFMRNFRRLMKSRQTRPVFGKPLNNGTVYTVLPVTRNFVQDTSHNNEVALYSLSFGDFVDVDNDGLLDFVVSINLNSNYVISVADHVYYRAVFINVGNAWTMNACGTNMDSANQEYLFLPACSNP